MTEQDTSSVEKDSSAATASPEPDVLAPEVAGGGEVEVTGDVGPTPPQSTPPQSSPPESKAPRAIDVDVDGDRAAVAIVDSEEGRVSRRLVGTDGKVLEALQELTRLAVQASTGERSRLMLDVAGFRAERRAAAVTVAQAAIDTVKSTNEKVAMDPMTAFERKVVHDEVLAAGLLSESEGVEPQRHVVVLPA